MQVSVETTSSIERRMTIGVPADQVDREVEQRLQQTAKTIRINGFRPGKVPAKVVKKRYGQSVRQEVLGEVMRNSYVEALTQEGINPIGYPKFEPKNVDEGADLEFVAIFEVYPEVSAPDVSKIIVQKPQAEIKEKDIKNMIDVLRRQHGTLKSVKRKSKKKDIMTCDFVGKIDGEAFQGGTANDQKITLGSGQMILGFEDGLIGGKAGEEITLDLTFPEDYGNEDLAGKDASFDVTIKSVEEVVLPEMNEEFFSKYGVTSDSEEEFKAEVVKNMERELDQAVLAKVKTQVVDQLVEQGEVDIPASMIEQEVNRMKQQAIQQFGGGQQMDLSQLPSELFQDQATNQVKTSMLFAAIIKDNDMKADAAEVDAKIAELAATYESPEEVVAWYGQPENRQQIESQVLEEAVVEHILTQAKVKNKKMSYDDAVKPEAPKAKEEKED